MRRITIKMHGLFAFIAFLVSFSTVLGKSGLECNEAKFFAPYAKVRSRPNGADIDMIDRTGFLDLSKRVNVILCLNGPAVLLSSFISEPIGHQGDDGELEVFSNSTFKVYSHHCMKINEISKVEVRRLKKEMKPFRLTEEVFVKNRVVGVNLIGLKDNYRSPTAAWFLQQKFGHTVHPQNLVGDGSFAVIGNSRQFCLRVGNDFNVILTSAAKTEEEICLWSVSPKAQFFSRYEEIFRSNRTSSIYVWEDCSTESTTTTPDPTQIGGTTIDPFSIIDPDQTPLKNGSSTEINRTQPKPQIRVEYRVELTNCASLPKFDGVGCISKIYLGPGDKACDLLDQAVPQDNIKVFEKKEAWKNEVLDLISEIFASVCGAFPSYMPYTVMRILAFYLSFAHESDFIGKYGSERSPVWDNLMTDLQICRREVKHVMFFDWNYEGLTEMDEEKRKKRKRSILGHSPDMELEDAKEEFLSRNLLSEEELRDANPFVPFDWSSSILQNSGGSQYNFLDESSGPWHREKKSSTAGTTPSSKPVIIQEYFEELSLRKAFGGYLGYPIDVHHVSGGPNRERRELFYFMDDAELQYELNIAIDMAWKIFATVAGYCSQHYKLRESETFPRLLNQFFRDFLAPIVEDWKSGEDNEILKIILNDWNSEIGMRWLDTCLEGSYVDSSTLTYRPPRPLKVMGGGSAENQAANHFHDLPRQLTEKYHERVTLSNYPKRVRE